MTRRLLTIAMLSSIVVPTLADAQTARCGWGPVRGASGYVLGRKPTEMDVTLDRPTGTGMVLSATVTSYEITGVVANGQFTYQGRPITITQPWPGGASLTIPFREFEAEMTKIGIKLPAIDLDKPCAVSLNYPQSLAGYPPASSGSVPRSPKNGRPLPSPK